ncbi:MAG: gfo/Idh/MocA family oxidoreductase [Actinobacteria bacterium]|nr:MAG: gfo/Idh/MocA family oxidoreductase [Actinomycetota bacterium]
MGRTHVRALAAGSTVVVTAVVEPVEAVRTELEADGVDVYSTVAELLSHGRFDGVLIAAPTDLHAELVETFAAAGFPILCEKPCGLRAADTATATRTAAEAGVLLQIGYWRRFVPELVELRRRIDAGELVLVDMGVHEFDQIRWLTGQEIDDVSAVAAAASSDEPVPGDPESIVALARLSGGAVATVSLGRRFPEGDCCWVELMGTGGHVRLPFMWGEPGTRVFLDALVAQAEAFAEAARGGPLRGATGDDAIRAIEAAERASEAAAVQTR